MNDSVEGVADTRDIKDVVSGDLAWLTGFTMVIAHNLEGSLLDKLAELLWGDVKFPSLVVVRSTGFLAEFYLQYHEHTSEYFDPSNLRTSYTRL